MYLRYDYTAFNRGCQQHNAFIQTSREARHRNYSLLIINY